MDRQDLIQLLTDAMLGRVDDGMFGAKVREGQVKSRLIEAHPPEASPDGAESLLAGVAEGAGARCERLSDDLWAIVGNEDIFFVDALNGQERKFVDVSGMQPADRRLSGSGAGALHAENTRR